MRKIFLVFLFLIPLIGLVSSTMTIDIQPPYIAPEILNVTGIDGASGFPAGEYWIVGQVGTCYNKMHNPSLGGSFWNGGCRTSPASNVFKVNLTANQEINITFNNTDPDARAIHFEYLIRTGTNDQWRALGKTPNYAESTGWDLSVYPSEIVVDSRKSASDYYNTRILKFEDYNTPYGLNYSKGNCLINVTGLNQNISITDFYKTLYTNTSTLVKGEDYILYYTDQLYGTGGGQLFTTCAINFNVESPYCVQFSQKVYLSNYFGPWFGDSPVCFYQNSYGEFAEITSLTRGGYGYSTWIKQGDIHQMIINGMTGGYYDDGIYRGEFSGAGNYIGNEVTGDKIILGTQWGNPSGGLKQYTYSSKVLNAYDNNFILENQNIFAFVQPDGGNFTLKDCTVQGPSSYDVLLLNYNYGNDHSLDTCFINITDGTCKRYPDTYILQYASGPADSNATMWMENTINLYVKNNLTNINESLENALVTITDKDGNLAYSGLTDADGYANIVLTRGALVSVDGFPSGVRDDNKLILDNNPYQINISKEGYANYTGIFELYFKQDWSIYLGEAGSSGGTGTTVIIATSSQEKDDDFPYLNYFSSNELDTSSGILIKPYVNKEK